ncbi:hypothetical protein A3712_22130 [Vibrio sp. HI00D65]|nr:hypothetical protein A3712_22130 [Vibrio sp. HI00D65]
MAAYEKIFAIYDQPFWRMTGLSGYANCQIGPLVKIMIRVLKTGMLLYSGLEVSMPELYRRKSLEGLLTHTFDLLSRNSNRLY